MHKVVHWFNELKPYFPEAYLEPIRTSAMELFCENS